MGRDHLLIAYTGSMCGSRDLSQNHEMSRDLTGQDGARQTGRYETGWDGTMFPFRDDPVVPCTVKLCFVLPIG